MISGFLDVSRPPITIIIFGDTRTNEKIKKITGAFLKSTMFENLGIWKPHFCQNSKRRAPENDEDPRKKTLPNHGNETNIYQKT